MIQGLKIKLNKICKWMLYVFVFLLPWQTRWILADPQINGQVWEYGRISLYAFDVIFIILLICFLLVKSRKLKVESFKNKKIQIIYYILFIVFIIVNIFVAINKLLTVYWWLRILQGILLVWMLSKIKFSKVKLAASFVISVSLSALLGVTQFLSQQALSNKWLGLAYHSARDLGQSVVEFADQRWLRAYGSFSHPNILAGFCVIAFILCIWLLSQKKLRSVTIKYRLFLTLVSLVIISGLFFSFSRAAWIVFVIIIINLLIKKIEWRVVGGSLLLLIVLSLVFLPLVKTRFYSQERLEINSNVERIETTKDSFELIKNNLWLGVGLGNYTSELQNIKPDLAAWDYQPVHNVYLLVLSEVGIVGWLIIILLFVFCLKKYKDIKRYKKDIIKENNFVFLFFCFFVFLFLFCFDHFWWTQVSGVLSVFLFLGFLNLKNLKRKEFEQKSLFKNVE